MKEKVLLTSGNGFVGHHIVEAILKNTDWDLVTIDRLSHNTKEGFDRMRDIDAYDDARVTHFTHDLNQPIGEGLAKEIGHVDYILHVAANSHVDTSIDEPVPFVMNNVKSCLEMLEYARTLVGLKKFLYFSTDEVMGTAPEGTDYKEGDRYNSGNPYSASKAAAEQLCWAYSNTYKIPIIITRGMNIVGERQHPEKYLPKVINYVLDGKTLKIHSDPTRTKPGQRHYIHARNVASAVLFAVRETDEFLHNIDSSKGVFHIVGEKELDNLKFAQLIANSVNKVLRERGLEERPLNYELMDFHSARPGHDLRYSLSGEKLRTFGWSVPVKLEEAIDKIVSWSLEDENLRWLGRDSL